MRQFIQRNFLTFATGSLGLSMVSGWMLLDYIQNQQRQLHAPLQQAASVLDDKSSRTKSREEVRLQLMVENALRSSWKENLNNAFDAQERFMLPGRDHGKDPKFLRKIDRKVNEVMKKQKQQKSEGTGQKEEDHTTQELDAAKAPEHQDKMQFWK